mgnify:CR=1 FL=1
MTKLLRYSLILLTICIVSDLCVTKAYKYSTASGVALNYDLKYNSFTDSPYRSKVDWQNQTYQNIGSHTAISSPCNNCQILTKLATESGNLFEGRVTVAGQTTTLYGGNYPDDFKLMLKRNDVTLLTTTHTGFWTINPL